MVNRLATAMDTELCVKRPNMGSMIAYADFDFNREDERLVIHFEGDCTDHLNGEEWESVELRMENTDIEFYVEDVELEYIHSRHDDVIEMGIGADVRDQKSVRAPEVDGPNCESQVTP